VFSPGYFEDLDLSCRLRMAGWRLAIVENCRIHHQGRATFQLDPDLPSIISRNYETFAGRWSHLPEHDDLVSKLRGPAVHSGVQA
jgi:GT2 family glycosyltransferase